MGSSSKILYSAGEGLRPGDFNLDQDLDRQLLFDSIAWNLVGHGTNPQYDPGAGKGWADAIDGVWNPATPLWGSAIRPLRTAGQIDEVDINDIHIQGGLFVQLPSDGILGVDDGVALVASTGRQVLTATAATAAMFRRDLVQCRIVYVDAPAESRDFRDAVTGALSSSNIVKRSDLEVQIAIKQGPEVATLDLANTPSGQTTPDAGWHVLSSFVVDDGGIYGQFFDYRRCWGRWSCATQLHHMRPEGGGSWIFADDAAGKHWYNAQAGSVRLWCPFPEHSMGHSGSSRALARFTTQRIEHISAGVNLLATGPPADIDIQFFRMTTSGQQSAAGNIFGIGNNNGDIGLRVPTVGDFTVFDNEVYPDDRPLWVNGSHAAQDKSTSSPAHDRIPGIRFEAGTNDRVYVIQWHGWGGF
jgi:hypothetical protein